MDGEVGTEDLGASEAPRGWSQPPWTVLGWARHVGPDLSGFANVQRFLAEVAARPAVQKSLREEGLAA